MGEVIYLNGRHDQSSAEIAIEQVRTGVFLLDKIPTEEILKQGDYVTSKQFGIAGEMAGKSENYAQGVMRDIALQMIVLEGGTTYTVNGVGGYLRKGTPEDELYWKIRGLMDNPYKIREGSRERLLLGRQLVHDTWAYGEGSELVKTGTVPQLGKVGQRVVSELVKII